MPSVMVICSLLGTTFFQDKRQRKRKGLINNQRVCACKWVVRRAALPMNGDYHNRLDLIWFDAKKRVTGRQPEVQGYRRDAALLFWSFHLIYDPKRFRRNDSWLGVRANLPSTLSIHYNILWKKCRILSAELDS